MKLKFLKNSFYLLVAVFLLGCEDAIDIEQVGRLTPDKTFITVDDFELGINGVYTTYDLTSEISFNAEYTDEIAEGVGSGGQGFSTAFIFNLTAASGPALAFFSEGYRQLNAVNRVIEASDGILINDESEQERFDNALGQAYALRAYSHFQLLSYYSTDYTDDNALGVILVTEVPEIVDQPLRSTNGEVFQSIENDLILAGQLIVDESSPTRTTVSNDFVKALRARIAAYRRDYPTAINLAQELLSDYPLANREDYPLIWTDESNEEIIFKLERTLNDPFDGQSGWAGGAFAFVNATAGGGAFYEFGRNLFNLFDPEDIRYDTFLAPSSIISPDYQNADNYIEEDILAIAKYPGSENQFLMNDLKVFRSSEMALIIAEGYADNNSLNGGSNSVASMLKMIRDARFEDPQPLLSFSSQQEAFATILNERRVELAFEGHRYKDVKRLGQRANQNIVRDDQDCLRFGVCELENDSFKLTLPLPIIEFNGNPGLRAQQNPGY